MMNARYVISNMLESIGANAVVLAARRNSLTVLCYHRVLDTGDPDRARTHPALVTSTRVFEQQMELLAGEFQPVTLRDTIGWLKGGARIPRRAVLVTFDDGWADTYANAFPVMKRLGIPGVVFLATGLIGTNERQWADVAYESIAARAGVEAASRELDRLKHMPSRLARSALDCGVTRRLAQPPNLDWPQISEMAANGFEFGSHTRGHVILPRESDEDVFDELRSSAQDIEARLGRAPMSFAYPDGQHDQRTACMVAHAGYRVAFTCDEGLVTRRSARFALPRLGVHDGVSATPKGDFSRAMFLTYLAGTIPWLYRRHPR
jgi:peptidoglycan/xylan/chitin deacetylase (PgdA/CDA1 family)